MGILDYLQRILNQIGSLINSDVQILTTLVTSGWSAVIFEGAKVTVDVHSLLTDPDCGQEAQCAKLTTVLGDLASLSMQLAALGAPQQTGSPVTLPTTPPAGYGGSSGSSIAAAVWGAVSDDEATQYGTIVAAQSAWLRVFGASGAMPARLSERATFNFDPFALIGNAFVSFPEITPASILSTHTSTLAWLNDVYPIGTWHNTGYDTYWANVSSPAGNALVTVEMTPSEFAWYRANADALILPSPTAPVWPGIGNVTFGVPTAFADVPFTVVGPMDGVVISITSVPQPNAQYGFNGTVSYRYLGSITFEDDNGDCEFAQSLGFQSAIYVPAHMNHASFCRIRPNKSGIVGTVTPWTKN